MKNLKLSSSLLALTLVGVFGATTTTVHAADTAKANQNITGTITSGGLSGGINADGGSSGLNTKDVNFTNLKIGSPITPVQTDNLITVLDHTGGSGWKLTAKQQKEDYDKSLIVSVQASGFGKQTLTTAESTVATGPSKVSEQKLAGSYTAEWGETPKAGDFRNIIEWNLTPKLGE